MSEFTVGRCQKCGCTSLEDGVCMGCGNPICGKRGIKIEIERMENKMTIEFENWFRDNINGLYNAYMRNPKDTAMMNLSDIKDILEKAYNHYEEKKKEEKKKDEKKHN